MPRRLAQFYSDNEDIEGDDNDDDDKEEKVEEEEEEEVSEELHSPSKSPDISSLRNRRRGN